jgi:hypothetical protein
MTKTNRRPKAGDVLSFKTSTVKIYVKTIKVMVTPLQRQWYWCRVPTRFMDIEEAVTTQELHGPFESELAAWRDQAAALLGDQSAATNGGRGQ